MSSLNHDQESKNRPRPITILALLLFLQAVGLFDLGLFFFTGLGIKGSLLVAALLAEPVNTLAMGLVFVPLALLALLAGVGFLRLWRTAWVMAMLLQGLCLLAALILYFNERPPYIYFLMLYSIVMVVYLNYSEVYATFQPTSILEEEEEV
jgi:hypothetical protein